MQKCSPFPDFSRDVLLAKLTAQLAVQNPPLPPKLFGGIGLVNLDLRQCLIGGVDYYYSRIPVKINVDFPLSITVGFDNLPIQVGSSGCFSRSEKLNFIWKSE